MTDAEQGRREHEFPGAVDHPFDTDPENPNAWEFQSDAACAIAWRADGYEAIQVFVDPALRDRAQELCAAVSAWAGASRDLDGLSREVMRWSETQEVSGSIHPNPPDRLSDGLIAISFTLG